MSISYWKGFFFKYQKMRSSEVRYAKLFRMRKKIRKFRAIGIWLQSNAFKTTQCAHSAMFGIWLYSQRAPLPTSSAIGKIIFCPFFCTALLPLGTSWWFGEFLLNDDLQTESNRLYIQISPWRCLLPPSHWRSPAYQGWCSTTDNSRFKLYRFAFQIMFITTIIT